MAELVAKRYAGALFEAGLELEKIDEFRDDLESIVNVLDSEDDLYKILAHPKISKDEKKELVKALFGENINREVLNFLYILIDKRRESNIKSIFDTFQGEYNLHKGIVEVTAITAVEMDDERKDKLTKALSEKMDKKVILTNTIDKDIIGGVMLKTSDKFIDGSIKGQLEDMEKAIKNVSL